MRLGVYNAILHDRSLPEAIKVIADLGLTGIELNSGGFLPATHIPNFDEILESDEAGDAFLRLPRFCVSGAQSSPKFPCGLVEKFV